MDCRGHNFLKLVLGVVALSLWGCQSVDGPVERPLADPLTAEESSVDEPSTSQPTDVAQQAAELEAERQRQQERQAAIEKQQAQVSRAQAERARQVAGKAQREAELAKELAASAGQQLAQRETERQQLLEPLLTNLTTENPRSRLEAVRAITRLGHKAATEPLMEAANKERVGQIRIQIAAALAKIRDPRALAALSGALHDEDQHVRSIAAQALAGFGGTHVAETLIEVLREGNISGPDRDRRLAALREVSGSFQSEQLAELWEDFKVDNETLLALTDSSAVDVVVRLMPEAPRIRQHELANLLGEIGDERAIDALYDRITGSGVGPFVLALGPIATPDLALPLARIVNFDAYSQLATALEQIPSAGLQAIEAELLLETEEPYRRRWHQILASLRHPMTREVLRKFVDTTSTVSHNHHSRHDHSLPYSIRALTLFRDQASFDVMKKKLTDVDPEVRTAALTYFGEFDDARSDEILLGVLNAPARDFPMLQAAVQLLGDSGRAFGLEHAKVHAEDADPAARNSAKHTLGLLNAPEELLNVLRDADPGIEQHTVVHLGELRYGPAVPHLLERLSLPNVEMRRAAATALGLIGDSEAVTPLVETLYDEDSQVVQNVAIALARIGDPVSVPPLVQTALRIQGDESTRTLVVETLRSFRKIAANAVATEMRNGVDPSTRSIAARTLGEMRLRSAIPALREFADDESPAVRHAIAWALGKIGDPSTTDDLVTLLFDHQVAVREAALEAIAELPLERAPPVVSVLAEREMTGYHYEATKTLSRLMDPLTFPLLEKLLSSSSPRVPRLASEALVRAGRSNAVPYLRRAIAWSDRDERVRLVGALGTSRLPEAARALRHIAQRDQPVVLMAALDALGSHGDASALATISPFLKHARVDVRAAAARALGKLADGVGLPFLLEALQDHSPKVVDAAGETLLVAVSPEAPSATSELVNALQDPNNLVRAFAAQSLAADSSPQVLAGLKETLNSDLYLAKLWAIRTLGFVGDSSVSEDVRPFLTSPDYPLREAAVLALCRLRDLDSSASLIGALNDRRTDVRQAAALGLALLRPGKNEKMMSSLLIAINDQHAALRAAAASALGEIGDAQAIEALEKATADVQDSVAVAATAALAVASNESAEPQLLNLLATGRPLVAVEAARQLARVGGESAIGPLTAVLDEMPELRKAAVIALAAIHKRRDQELSQELTAAYAEELRRTRRALQTALDNAEIHDEIARLLVVNHDDLDSALTHSRRACYLNPTNAHYLNSLADVYASRGQYREALEVRSRPQLARSSDISPRLNRAKVDHLQRQLARR